MALMQCPSVLSVPTLMCHFYSLKARLRPPHTTIILLARAVEATAAAIESTATSTNMDSHEIYCCTRKDKIIILFNLLLLSAAVNILLCICRSFGRVRGRAK